MSAGRKRIPRSGRTYAFDITDGTSVCILSQQQIIIKTALPFHILGPPNSNSPKLNDADIWLFGRAVHGDLGHPPDPILDGVGDVRHNLHRLTEIVAATLLLDNVQVDLAGGDIVFAGEPDREVTLVVAEIEIDFGAYRGSDCATWLCMASLTYRSTRRSIRRARRGP